jgi:hypothetical protein
LAVAAVHLTSADGVVATAAIHIDAEVQGAPVRAVEC